MGTFDWDIPADRIAWSRRHEALWGFAPGEFAGTYSAFSERVHAQDLPRINAEIQRCIAERKPFSTDFRVVWPDASVHWIDASGEFEFDATGNALRMRGAVFETTDRKYAEEQLKKAEERFRKLFDNASVGIIVCTLIRDENGRIVDYVHDQANKAILRHAGITENDVIGKRCSEIIPPGEMAPFIKMLTSVLETGEPYSYEQHFPSLGRSIENRPFMIGNDTLAITFFDITERKRAEAALREGEEKLRLFVQNAPSAIAMFDADMRYLVYSERWRTDYGLGQRELAGRSHYEIFPDIPEEWKAIHRRCLAGEVVKSEGDRFPRADGSLDWVRWEVHPWHTGTGEIGGLIIFSEVITERVQAQTQLREQRERLRDLSWRLFKTEDDMRRHLGRELHDRVGPNLSALLLNLGMARGRLPPAAERELGPRFDDCNRLLTDTVEQLRDVMADLRPPALDELGLMAALTHLLGQTRKRAGLEFDIKGGEPAPRLPAAVESALFRIALGALNPVVKHAQATRVALALRATPAAVTLSLADDGRGFDPAAAQPTGAGLGMITMRERAEAAGGRFAVESSPGGGTRIAVEVPRQGETVIN